MCLLSQVGELTGHQGRALHMATSPDGSSVVSAGQLVGCALNLCEHAANAMLQFPPDVSPHGKE